jgi:TolA-binding protein
MSRALLLAALASGLSACIATQQDVLDLENQTDQLKAQVSELKTAVNSLQADEGSLKTTINSMQANQADLSVQMKQLHDELGVFTETINESQAQMSKLSSKLDDMSATVASKVASIGSTLTTQQAKSIAEQKAALAKQQASIDEQESALANSPTELFNNADVRLSVKSYALAAKGFSDYVAKFPDGALVDVAAYKLGQAFYGLKKWEEAGRQFALVLEKYPKSEMTASARLMYALSLIAMKKNLTEARQYLESIGLDFPASPEAKAAALQLKKLSARPKRRAASPSAAQ